MVPLLRRRRRQVFHEDQRHLFAIRRLNGLPGVWRSRCFNGLGRWRRGRAIGRNRWRGGYSSCGGIQHDGNDRLWYTTRLQLNQTIWTQVEAALGRLLDRRNDVLLG